MNSALFRTVNSNDRYIPRRLHNGVALFHNQTAILSLDADANEDKELEFINYAKRDYNRHNYENTLRSILMPIDAKVLNFFPPKKFTPTEYSVRKNQIWPVKGRKKPVINQPEMILDMPQFDTDICHHVADWSSKDCLATIFEYEVHMWYPDSESCREVTRTMKRVQNCVKWRPDGKTFAMGLLPNHVGIWDTELKMITCEKDCCILPFCEILCLEWLSDDHLLTGCSRGVITLYTVNRKFIPQKKVRHTLEDNILTLSSSCKKNFVASTAIDDEVTIWKIPELEIYDIIKCGGIVRSLAWHPWKSSILALNLHNNGNQIVFWNINILKEIARERLPYTDCTIDTLIFNPLSGELVISYFVRDPQCRNKGRGIIGVLTTLIKIVEEIYCHSGPILYLLWGNDGKVLASASADENLCLWNFFGSKERMFKAPFKKKAVSKYIENSLMFRGATLR